MTNPPTTTPNQTTPNGFLSFEKYRMANEKTNGTVDKYKIDPQIVKKAEDLLGGSNQGKASLDNTDLTITSLNYIDEYQSYNNGRNLQNIYLHSPEYKR